MLVVYWRVSYSCKCDSRPLSCHLSFWKRDKRLCECKRRAYGWCLMKRCTFSMSILCGEVISYSRNFRSTFSRGFCLRLEARLQSLQGMGVFWWFLTPPIRRLYKLLLRLETGWGFEKPGEARIEWSCARCASCRSACGNKDDDHHDQQGPVL